MSTGQPPTTLSPTRLGEEWKDPRNQSDLFVFSEDDIPALWVSLQAHRGELRQSDIPAVTDALKEGRYPNSPAEAQRIRKVLEGLLSAIPDVLDAKAIASLIGDFRGFGRFRVSMYQGRRYVIFKGDPRLRNIVRGTRYRLDNPKIVGLGIGKRGLKANAVAGLRLSIVLFVGYRIGEFILTDEATLSYFVGHLSTDVVKATGAAAASYGAGYFAAGFIGAGIAGPLVFALAIGVVAAIALDQIDSHYGLTDRLVAELSSLQETAEDEVTDFFYELDRAIYNFFIGRLNPGSSGFMPSYR